MLNRGLGDRFAGCDEHAGERQRRRINVDHIQGFFLTV